MPLILGTNSIKDTGYEVANSLRFDDDSTDYLTRTPSSAGNRQIWTFSAWVKRSTLGNMRLLSTHDGSNADNQFTIKFDSSNRLQFYDAPSGSTVSDITTNRVFRDVSAWYHIVASLDSTQATASNRIKLYVNGVQETSLAVSTYGSQNFNTQVNGTNPHQIGRRSDGIQHFDGYMAEVVLIDGQQLDPTSFGEFDADSPTIWKPIDVSGLTFGTNGFYLDFEDSSALGNDVSGNNNDFTANNLTAIDQSTDTCTNNFCTMNPLYPDGTITFSEGNLKLTQGSSWRSAGGTMAVSTGKWFWEVSNVGNYAYIGFADIQLFSEGCSIRESFTTGAATTGRAHSVLNSDGRHYQVTSGGAQSSEYPSGATFPTFTNSIISIALNLDDNNFIFYKDGTAMNPSGTPISITAGTYIPAVSIYGNNVSYNFGSPPYSESGGNSDGNGYGNFSMSVPSGYYALNTKNLAEYG